VAETESVLLYTSLGQICTYRTSSTGIEIQNRSSENPLSRTAVSFCLTEVALEL
jgi:hypothetical protein